MSPSNSLNSTYNSRGVLADVAKTTFPVNADAFEASAFGDPWMATTARLASLSLSTSPSSLNPGPLSDDDLSDYEPDSTISPPSYQSIYRPTSPVSSIASSPTDSFHFGKAGAAAPLLSPPYTEEAQDPFAAASGEASLLKNIFPAASASVHALPTTAVKVDDLIGAGWEGAVVHDSAAGLRTLYVAGGKLEDLELREAVVDVIDRAEEQWGANGVVLALEKSTEDLGNLVHGLTYVGFTVFDKPDTNPDLLLLALDLV
ncbi:hypothetical protein JCM10213v2_004826 [Rhodosporidiobolus nylandii]